MKNPYSHFYLYAKGHYPKTELWKDMLVILEDYSGCNANKWNLMTVISNIVAECVFKLYDNPAWVMGRFHSALRGCIVKQNCGYDEAYVRASLVLMSMSPIGEREDKFQLAEPKESLFGSISE